MTEALEQELRKKLNALLRKSYGHVVSVHVLAAASLALLLSAVLFFLSPILEDDYHVYSEYLPWVYYLDWSHYDSFVVDHVVVFLSISLPMGWLFLVNIANSSLASRVDIALLLLRVVCCAIVCFALTVILTEFLSRRVMIALISLAYGSLGLVYSWSVPVWRWYVEEASAKGLVAVLPASLQHFLLQTSLLEWLTDTTFMDKVKPFLPLLLPLSKAEQSRVLEKLPVESQIMLTRPGMVAFLPPTVQKVLLPSTEDEELSTALVSRDGDNQHLTVATRTELSPTAPAGFDFHHSSSPSSSATGEHDDVVGDIMTTRIIRGCMEMVKVPSSQTLYRTMTVSTAVVALQLYASKGSRRMLVSLLQFAVASSLVSVASFAFVVRVIQVLTAQGGQSVSLLRYFRQYLIRSWTSAGQIAADPNQQRASKIKTIQSAATSVSAVLAVLYVLKRLRR